MSYAVAIASAQRLIAAKGQACVWRKPAPLDDAADAWRDVRDGEPTDADVSIAWFAPRDLGRGTEQFLSQLAGMSIDVPEGVEIGLMAAVEFEPLPSDTIVRGVTAATVADETAVSIISIDRLAPDGTPILYFVKVKR